jgi:hypothetical protein
MKRLEKRWKKLREVNRTSLNDFFLLLVFDGASQRRLSSSALLRLKPLT